MLFSRASKFELSPPATFLTGIKVFRDHSVVVLDVVMGNKSTTLRYFQQSDHLEKHQSTFGGTITELVCLKDKEILLVDGQKREIIVVNYDKGSPQIASYKHEQLDGFFGRVITFSEANTFLLLCQKKSTKQNSTILYFRYPATLLYKQEIQIRRRKCVKLSQKGEIGLFSPSFEGQFILQTLTLQPQVSELIVVPLAHTTTVRDVRRCMNNKLLFLLSDNKTIPIFDTFDSTLQTLICITSPQFNSPKTINPANNIIFSWLPLQDYIAILACNTKSTSPDRMYLCSYDGRMIASHPATIDSIHSYLQLLGGRQYSENIHKYRGAKQIEIIQWEVPTAKEMEAFLVVKGLGLNEEMVPWVVNAIDYDR